MINVAILDYGTGNIASLASALRTINAKATLVNNLKDICKADALILPGVGHYGHALNNLKKNSLIDPILKLIKEGLPTLGICLGFQLLTISSQESSDDQGLGILPLKTTRIKQNNPKIYKTPHIGWNFISNSKGESKLLNKIPANSQLFYYCNAYGVDISKNFKGIYAEYTHENNMLALVEYKNIFGVQFHPEKSRKQGLQLLYNFLF